MNNPLVSVYITNYNYARYLRQSVESVFAQSLQDFELIIIDDGSTDESRDIIESYRPREAVTIIYQQNKGLNITNNVAMRVSRGRYLMRLDADDFLAPEALAEMVALLEANPDLGLVFPDYFYVDADGQVTGEERRHNFEREVSLYDQPAHGACTMIRLAFLKKLGGYNESFTCQDGYDLWLKFITHFSVSNINKPLFYYRRHGENLTSNENRILATRRAIKESYIQGEQSKASTLIVIPVRNTRIQGQSWPLHRSEERTVLEEKVATCLQAQVCAAVYVVSADPEILSFGRKAFGAHPQVEVLERPSRLAGPNQSLGATVALATEHAARAERAFSFVMTATLDYPFTEAPTLDDAVHTQILFQSDAVLTVRPDNQTYYRHTGHGLSPILDQEKFTRIEREALYKAAGGLMLSTRKSFEQHQKINAGRISHVVVDERTAFGVFSDYDFQLYCLQREESRQRTKPST